MTCACGKPYLNPRAKGCVTCRKAPRFRKGWRAYRANHQARAVIEKRVRGNQ